MTVTKTCPGLKIYQEYFCSWDSAPDTSGEAYNAPADPVARFWRMEDRERQGWK